MTDDEKTLGSDEPIDSEKTDCSSGPEAFPGQPATAEQHADAINAELDQSSKELVDEITDRLERAAEERRHAGQMMRDAQRNAADQSLSGRFTGTAKLDLKQPVIESAKNRLPVHIQCMYRPGQVRMQFSRQCEAMDFTVEEANHFIRIFQQHITLAHSQAMLVARDRRKAN